MKTRTGKQDEKIRGYAKASDMVREGWKRLAPVARINETIPEGAKTFSAISALESVWYMRNMLLRDSDWAAMAHSLEIRVPLVDMELTMALAPLMQQSVRPDKKLMAQCAWAGVPPEAIINRPKTGFSIPVRQWLLEGAGSGERGHRAWARLCIGRCSNIRQSMGITLI